MRINLGAGWRIVHLTDRTVLLEKDCPIYRRFVGADGRVLVRAEPGMGRDQLLTKAMQMAERNDAELGLKVAKRLAPSLASLAAFRNKQRGLAKVFGVPGEEPSERVYRP